jgi:hypothetical protein
MAKDELIGNIPSEIVFPWLAGKHNIEWAQKIQWTELTQLALGVYQSM